MYLGPAGSHFCLLLSTSYKYSKVPRSPTKSENKSDKEKDEIGIESGGEVGENENI